MKAIAPGSEVAITVDGVSLGGLLDVPIHARGLIVFAHGSGNGRHSPRNRHVARVLGDSGFATLLMDLLTSEEELEDEQTLALRFDIPRLARRLVHAKDWAARNQETGDLSIGYFGASTGAGAALMAAAQSPGRIQAVVSRGGRPDLAGYWLGLVRAPTLFVVGELDFQVVDVNRLAKEQIKVETAMKIVPGATHLFEEGGTLEQVADSARRWFDLHFER